MHSAFLFVSFHAVRAMKILHLYDKASPLTEKYVMLLSQCDESNEVRLASQPADLQTWTDDVPDIVHIHGCWRFRHAQMALSLRKRGARLLLSPHHELQPWVISQHRVGEKWPKQLLWQKRLVAACYCVVASGTWERQALSDLAWNERIMDVPDAVLTQQVAAKDMVRTMVTVYRKILDTHPRELLSEEALTLLPAVLKVGVTGDRRWLQQEEQLKKAARELSNEDWRHLYIYAHHEGITSWFNRGIELLAIPSIAFDAERIDIWRPLPSPEEEQEHTTIEALISSIRRCVRRRRLSYRLLVDLTTRLFDDTLSEERLMSVLRKTKQDAFFASLLTVLAETTLLDEGFMPCLPVDNKTTEAIRQSLAQHLAIIP